MSEWPVVTEDDDGLRGSNVCFYCNQPIGKQHGQECVIVKKKVKLRYIFELEVDVPRAWDEHQILFHRNEGSWCADNALNDLEAFRKSLDGDCLCPFFTCELVAKVVPPPIKEHEV